MIKREKKLCFLLLFFYSFIPILIYFIHDTMAPRKKTTTTANQTNAPTNNADPDSIMTEVDNISELSTEEFLNQATVSNQATNGGIQWSPNSTSQSIWASNTTVRSARMVISDEERKNQLQKDIADMKKETYKAFKATVITPATDPSYEAIWAHETKLKNKLNRTIKTFKSLFGSGPLTKSKTMPVPPNLSVVE
jgi:hypothetical protein